MGFFFAPHFFKIITYLFVGVDCTHICLMVHVWGPGNNMGSGDQPWAGRLGSKSPTLYTVLIA